MITETTVGTVVMSNCDAISVPVSISMTYSETSPLDVTFVFQERGHDDPLWRIGRDLINECFEHGSSGCGDIILIDNDWFITMVLMSDEGTAAIQVPSEDLCSFLEETEKLVPVGREPMDDLIDDAIRAILES